MGPIVEAESTLTDHYQTTIPAAVRHALNLGKRDKIRYIIRANGEVVLARAEPADGEDPALGQFLNFLARDMATHPERVQAVGSSLAQRLRVLASTIDVALDAKLPGDDEADPFAGLRDQSPGRDFSW